MRGRSSPFVFSLVLLGVGCGEATTPDGSTPVVVVEDADEDGRTEAVDCDDTDPAKGGAEVPYDGIDQDCDPGTRDDDLDQDGLVLAEDCDDSDPAKGGEELPYDGVDQDCDPGTPDDDLDQDGLLLVDDCDDTDPELGGVEVPFDGVDNDCDPETADVPGDLDSDGVPDASDRCPRDPDPGQEDADLDGLGDACEDPVLMETWSAEGDDRGAWFGWAIGFGDADADGSVELAISAPTGALAFGTVSVFAGEASGPAATPDVVLDARALAGAGEGLAWGDFDGDGFDDLAVGGTGLVRVYRGSSVGLETECDLLTDTSNAYGGDLVAVDLNADGLDDLAIGSPNATAPVLLLEAGAVYVHEGSSDGLVSEPYAVLRGSDYDEHFGEEMAAVGDVDGDGYPELAVGMVDAARVEVFRGSTDGVRPNRAWWVHSPERNSELGMTVAGGDVNGDGYSDLVLGDASKSGVGVPGVNVGSVFAFFGSPAGLSSTPDWSVLGEQQEAMLGGEVAVGDVDGDGFADVAAAASWFDGGQPNEGAVFLFLGSPTGPAGVAAWSAQRDQGGARFGDRLLFGDSNNDGRADLAAASTSWDNAVSGAGKVWLFQGQPR